LHKTFDTSQLHARVFRWHRTHRRTFAWDSLTDPYAILVREVMLQQTQVARVEQKFPEWMQRFPTVQTLAVATGREVLLAWSGMGYNRRALHLHAAAKTICEKHNAMLPQEPHLLRLLPGIGMYTSHAVASFAFGRRVPIVDVNIRRILSRFVEKQQYFHSLRDEKVVWRIAREILPQRKPAVWNQALMDLGATICTATHPACSSCPVQSLCPSAGRMKTAKTVTGQKKTVPRRIHRGRIIEFLRRATPAHTATFHAIGAHLTSGFSSEHHAWLKDILESLQKDSMIAVTVVNRNIDLNRYSAALTRLRISLA
jgi:A/G-specific adenine glycosylase